MPEIVLVELGLGPERGVIGDLQDGHPGFDPQPLHRVAHLLDDEAGGGREYPDRARDRPRFGERVDLRLGHVPVEQALPGRLQEGLRALDRLRVGPAFPQALEVVHRPRELALGRDQFRAVDLEEHIAPFDRLAHVVDAGLLDPARVLGLDRDHPLLVVRQDADRADEDGERTALHVGRAHGEVLQEARAHPDLAVREAFVLVDGNQIHPHRRLAGAVRRVVRIHGRSPVEDPAFTRASGGRRIGATRPGFSMGCVVAAHSGCGRCPGHGLARHDAHQKHRPARAHHRSQRHDCRELKSSCVPHDPSSSGDDAPSSGKGEPMARSMSASVFM